MKDYIEDKILQKIELIEDSSNYSRVIPTKVVDQLYDTLRVYGSGYFRLYFSISKNPWNGNGDYHSLFSSYLLKNNMVSDSYRDTIHLSISEAREYKLNRLLPMLLN